MNAQLDNTNTVRLITLIESVAPIFQQLGKVINESRKLESGYNERLHFLTLHFKMDQGKDSTLIADNDIELKVRNICYYFEKVGEILDEISKNDEECRLIVQSGIMNKYKEISQKLIDCLVSKPH
ncbi:hypothetical protein BN59_02536 [Legionella massiliensis]|uniref:Uncharacterized protein n=1 Tax=Legionella massiliensis TaxID=1034943 RepID=A0A078L2J1_9GAMM|nr:hypothetical protein [Legionella massiliensis]CDZ78228.1 hypothetical protein BN59_02536 [Legionella massiliensis]CEE13966.1 hypothetical protein BN1094_02536 [Legionella massiliensis]